MRRPYAILVLWWLLVAPPATAQTRATAVPTVGEALASLRDVWGELAMRRPEGPTYEFFRNLLPPLRYVNCSFRHYPIALAAPLGRAKARLVSNGSGVNLPSGLRLKHWREYPLGVTLHVGRDDEAFGRDLSRLDGPVYDRGYLPIVQTRYRVGPSAVAQEAFVPADGPLADGATVLVRLSLADGNLPVHVALALDAAPEVTPRGPLWAGGDGRWLLWLGRGWESDGAAKRVGAELRPNEPLLFAVSSIPAEPPSGELDDGTYRRLRSDCETAWQGWLSRCLDLEVPEERINRAWKATLVGNLMMASGDRMNYSAGNVYERLYEAESGDALRSLLLYGLTEQAKAMADPLLRYEQKGLGFHDAAFRLQLLGHLYWLTRDAQFVRSRRDLWRPSVDLILAGRGGEFGLLPKENYCGDVHTQVYSLNSNANCWRGLRDVPAVLRDMNGPGEAEEASKLSAAAGEFRQAILAAVAKSERRDVTPWFIPVALFGAEQPYQKLTDTMLGSYWDLMIPYVLGSGVLDEPRRDAALAYLQTRGGLCIGMVRFHQHSGLFANEDAVDDLYTLRYAQTLLRRDDPGDAERVLVSFYGKLAQGLTPDTFVGGEGTGLVPLGGDGRAMYLPPNSAGNGFFLTVLRELLVQEEDRDADGAPDALRLLFATPRQWLGDGKTIRLEGAPTAFGPISVVARSHLSAGRVTVDVTPPPREIAAMRLRVRLPAGWKAIGALANGSVLQLGPRSTLELPRSRKRVRVEVSVARE